MNTLQETLCSVANIALQNIQTQASNRNDITTENYFGFKIKRPQHIHDRVAEGQKIQKIIDWQQAAQEVNEMITSRGLQKPLAIVPKKVFDTILELMEITDFKNALKENGNIYIPPMVIETAFSLFDPIAHISNPSWDVSIQEIKKVLFYKKYPYLEKAARFLCVKEKILKSLQEKSWDFDVEHTEAWRSLPPGISIKKEDFGLPQLTDEYTVYLRLLCALSKDMNPHGSMIAMMQKTPFVQKEFLFKNDEKSHINRWVFSIKKHSRYDIMKHVLSCIQESNYLEPSAQELDFLKQEKASFASQVHFEKLPQNIEDILMGVKEKFPSWHVSVACDPYFFSITSPLGKDFWKYAQERADYWRGKYAEADAMVLEFLTNSEKWKQALIDQGISFAGTISSQQMYEDIRDGKWADDKDPIFYTPVKHTYHHTKYDMVVVWTQYGKSPKEADAIAYLQALTAADFEGFMNM